MCDKLIGEDHELAAQIAYDEMVAEHANDDPANDINFNGLTEENKKRNKQIGEEIEQLNKKLQKQIDKDCGRAYLPSYKKEVKSLLTFDKEALKELLKEYLTIRVEANKEWRQYDGNYVNVSVSIHFDEELISCNNSCFSL